MSCSDSDTGRAMEAAPPSLRSFALWHWIYSYSHSDNYACLCLAHETVPSRCRLTSPHQTRWKTMRSSLQNRMWKSCSRSSFAFCFLWPVLAQGRSLLRLLALRLQYPSQCTPLLAVQDRVVDKAFSGFGECSMIQSHSLYSICRVWFVRLRISSVAWALPSCHSPIASVLGRGDGVHGPAPKIKALGCIHTTKYW